MSIKQIIKCDICGKEEKEKEMGVGFKGWGALQGISLDKIANPNLCPDHLNIIAEILDKIKNGGST